MNPQHNPGGLSVDGNGITDTQSAGGIPPGPGDGGPTAAAVGGTGRGWFRGLAMLLAAGLLGGIVGGLAVWYGLAQRGALTSASPTDNRVAPGGGVEPPLAGGWSLEPVEPVLPAGENPTSPYDPSETSTMAVVRQALPSVVQLRVRGTHPDLEWEVPIQGSGSGFVFDTAGHVVTNNHVVEDSSQVEVIFSDGAVAQGRVVGTDRLSDLAVLAVVDPPGKIVPLAVADSDLVMVGQKAIAIGSPLGDEEGVRLGLNRAPTVTQGIVSARDRTMPVMSKRDPGVQDFQIENLLQTDAAINPGNSGGPLLDSRGRVIGVNTAIVPTAQGIGFAIPSNVVLKVVPQLIANGEVRRAFLGITYQDLAAVRHLFPAEIALPDTGALVIEVHSGSPSEKAGVRGSTLPTGPGGVAQPGDIVVALNGVAVDGTNLAREVLRYRPGETVKVTVFRGTKTQDISIALGER